MQLRRPLLAALAIDALDDLERSLLELTVVQAERRSEGMNSISWIVAHVAQHIDSWINDSMAGKGRDSYLSSGQFARASSGEPAQWHAVGAILAEVLIKARSYLTKATDNDLARESLYIGSIEALRATPVSGNYRIARLVAHIYYHVGEISTIRAVMKHKVGDFPSVMPVSLASSTSKSGDVQ